VELGLICIVRRLGIETVASVQKKHLLSWLTVARPAYSPPCENKSQNGYLTLSLLGTWLQ